MMNRIARSIRPIALALAMLVLASTTASAQLSGPGGSSNQAPRQAPQQNRGANRSAPPLPPATDSLGAVTFLYYALIIILGGVTVAVSIMPGKRGHQD